MIKGKELYPKTKRVKVAGDRVYVTEKLDGSNLCFFKKDDEMYVAQRNNIYKFDELEQYKGDLYKGLYQWILDNKEELSNIYNNAVICGEWLGMGKLKYDVGEFDKRWYMFAKANINDNFQLYNLIYDHDLFFYSFLDQQIPKCIGIVPNVAELNVLPNKEHLDSLYDKYRNKVNRDVEGFVVNYNNIISKYVRMKNNKMQEHHE